MDLLEVGMMGVEGDDDDGGGGEDDDDEGGYDDGDNKNVGMIKSINTRDSYNIPFIHELQVLNLARRTANANNMIKLVILRF